MRLAFDLPSLSEGYAVPEGPADPAVVTRVSAAGYGDGSRPMISPWPWVDDDDDDDGGG